MLFTENVLPHGDTKKCSGSMSNKIDFAMADSFKTETTKVAVAVRLRLNSVPPEGGGSMLSSSTYDASSLVSLAKD